MNTIEDYRNLIEDLVEEKEDLLNKLEARGAHALRIIALRSEVKRCKRVLDGKPYTRKSMREESK